MDLRELLRDEDIALRMPAKGKRSALARVSGRLGERTGICPGAVLASLLERERLGSTGIGHGVAMPHARLKALEVPAAMLATLQHPVDFGSPDLVPVDLLLAFLLPQSDMAGFLPTLAKFCRLLRAPELRDRLRESADPAEAYAALSFPRTPCGLQSLPGRRSQVNPVSALGRGSIEIPAS